MAVHIRLTRAGAKKAPYYHIIAADSRSRRDGRFLEALGSYRPSTGEVKIDEALVEKWVKNGAHMTETVRSLLRKHARAHKGAEG
jgi:small subunit ribosomal protein S16